MQNRQQLPCKTVHPKPLSKFLDTYANMIEANGEEICRMAALETALPYEPRLKTIELARTTNQLRQAATAVRERYWRTATIDSANNIRSMLGPLAGPVVIFGPNNFPLAFNAISGGDFAAAIAAGNPVIAKAHPKPSEYESSLSRSGVGCIGTMWQFTTVLVVQMFYHCATEDGLKLVSHSDVGAIAFTGSRPCWFGLKKSCRWRVGNPICLEMSSVNPVFMLSGALVERGDALAAEFTGSCTLASGQFCTNPGLDHCAQ